MKITFKNHLKLLSFQFYGTLLMLVVLIYYRFEYDMLTIFSVFWLIYTIPAFYLHIEYYLKNKGKKIDISPNEITVEKNNNVTKYLFSELNEIILYKPRNLDKGNIQFVAMESYYFVKLTTNKGKEIIITCLLEPDIEQILRNNIKGINVTRKKIPFCSIFFNS